MYWVTLGSLFILLIAYAVNYAKKKNNYWKHHGIPYVKPHLFIGNYLDVILKRKTSGELVRDITQNFPDEPLIGYYMFMTPVLIVNNLNLIERVLIKDFHHFVDHGVAEVDGEAFPLHKNLFTETGKKWRAVRYKMSPMFTSGKLKIMVTGLVEQSKLVVPLLEAATKSGNNKISLIETLARTSFDMFGSCGFGLETEKMSEFRAKAGRITSTNWFSAIKNLVILGFPGIAKKFGFTLFENDIVNYFTGIIRKSMEYREKENFVRNDFAQMLMALKEKGFIEMKVKDSSDDYLNMESDVYLKESFDFTFDEVLGYSFNFLISGTEPMAVAATALAHELSLCPEVQENAREEIRRCIEENDGLLDYKSLKNMVYLEQCIKESLRKYPLAEILFRACTKEYTFPGTGYTAKPGDVVNISTLAIQYDPKIYANPDKFDPERFSPDSKMPPCSYLVFSDGPRICIGMRLALVEIKIIIAQLLLYYRIRPSSKTVQLRWTPLMFAPWPRNNILFDLEKL